MLEKNKLHSHYSPVLDLDEFLKTTRTSFLYPRGLCHFLSIPATIADVLRYLKKENLLITGPLPASLRNDLPPIPCYVCKWKNDVTSSGTDTDPYLAMIKSLSEGLERTLTYNRNDNLDPIYINPAKKIINPFKKETYFEEQYLHDPFLGVNSSDPTEYVHFENILTAEPVSIPAQYVFWGETKKNTHISTTTNGSGAHTEKEQATLSAIHEYIERDAFLLHWLCKIVPLKIDTDSIKSPEALTLISNIEAMGLELHILALDSKVGVPTFISCLFDYRRGTPVFAVAGATNAFNYENAIYGALTESISILQESLDNIHEISAEKITPPFLNHKIGRKERIFLWKGEWIRQELKWLISGEMINLKKIKENFPPLERLTTGNDKKLVTHMKRSFSELEVLCYYVKSPILSSLGIHVAKVFIPQLLTFYLYEGFANINSARLFKILGKKDSELLASLNPLPHPYP